MGEALASRVRAAAAAGWAALLIFWALLVAGWLAVLAIVNAQPEWVRQLLGGPGVTWEQVQWMYLTGLLAMKLVFLVALILVVWLTFWARRLKRTGS